MTSMTAVTALKALTAMNVSTTVMAVKTTERGFSDCIRELSRELLDLLELDLTRTTYFE